MQLPLRIAELEEERFWHLPPQCPPHFLRWRGCFPEETCNTSKTNVGCLVWPCLDFRAGFPVWTNARLRAKFKKVKIRTLHIQEYIKENEAPAAISTQPWPQPQARRRILAFTSSVLPSHFLQERQRPCGCWGCSPACRRGAEARGDHSKGQNTVFLNFLLEETESRVWGG